MNQIDQKFKELVVEISRKKKEEIFNKIKETYNNQHPDVKTALENYFKTFNLRTLITRCSNNYGPNQYPEKLIPLCILNILKNKNVTLYGNGLNIRNWIYVDDHVNALDKVLHKGKIGEIYNIAFRKKL